MTVRSGWWAAGAGAAAWAGGKHQVAIVDLHDAPGLPGAPERLLATMPGLLDVLEARGYAAVPVGELLAEAPAAG